MGSFDTFLSRTEISSLAKRLGTADVAMRKALPRKLREAVKPIAEQAKVNAAPVSPNIKIGTRVKLASRNGASVKVIGTSPNNPSIAGLEERGNHGDPSDTTFTHPVFGRGSVTQDMHPYIQPAMDAGADEAIAKTSEVMTEVALALLRPKL